MLSEIKIIGSALIAASGICEAVRILKDEKNKTSNAKAVRTLIENIRFKIESLSMPIPHILCELNSEILTDCGYKKDDLPSSCKALIDSCPFRDDTELFYLYKAYLTSLGKGYKKEELARCDAALLELNTLCEKRKAEAQKKQKTIPAVALTVSAGIIILLL